MSPLSESNWDHKNAPDSENPDIEAFSPIRNKVKWPNWDRKTESYPSRQQNSFNILLKRYCLHNYYQCSLMKVTESEKNACKNTRERVYLLQVYFKKIFPFGKATAQLGPPHTSLGEVGSYSLPLQCSSSCRFLAGLERASTNCQVRF